MSYFGELVNTGSINQGMDHGGNGGMHHGGDGMSDSCSMNMLFTWDYRDTCVIFHWWHIRSLAQFITSILAIALLSMGYEYCRFSFNKWHTSQLASFQGLDGNRSGTTFKTFRLKKLIFYGFQIGFSFLLMLIFMTYNGWLMLAVVVGGGLGNYIWNTEFGALNCH